MYCPFFLALAIFIFFSSLIGIGLVPAFVIPRDHLFLSRKFIGCYGLRPPPSSPNSRQMQSISPSSPSPFLPKPSGGVMGTVFNPIPTTAAKEKGPLHSFFPFNFRFLGPSTRSRPSFFSTFIILFYVLQNWFFNYCRKSATLLNSDFSDPSFPFLGRKLDIFPSWFSFFAHLELLRIVCCSFSRPPPAGETRLPYFQPTMERFPLPPSPYSVRSVLGSLVLFCTGPWPCFSSSRFLFSYVPIQIVAPPSYVFFFQMIYSAMTLSLRVYSLR